MEQNSVQSGKPGIAEDGRKYRIGIVGGGQLAKMTALAAFELGCEVVILEKTENTPASRLAADIIYGDWDDPAALLRLAARVDVVSLENEFVDAASLRALEEAGHKLYPGARTIGLVQDKLVQKRTLEDAGISVAPFAPITFRPDITVQGRKLGWPLVVKARRYSYDGKGNATVNGPRDIDAAWKKLGGDKRGLYIEGFCDFARELAVIIIRAQDGAMVNYPVVETVQRDHICHIVRAPAEIEPELAERAVALAREAVVAIDGIGALGVEMFLSKAGDIVLNEVAPRVHNSGHYTIEACECSQFENHVRALLGLPLGSPRLVTSAAVMVNLLGERSGNGEPAGIDAALQEQGAHVHVYGKAKTTPGRKMGHVTALGPTLRAAEQTALAAAGQVHFGAPQ